MFGSISILSISVISLHANVVIMREVIFDILGLYTGYYIHIGIHTGLRIFWKYSRKLVIDPPPTSSNTLKINIVTKYIYLNIQIYFFQGDIWHVKWDMWHVTYDMWHITHGGETLSKFQVPKGLYIY